MKKYTLREGEEFIKEYIDNENKHVTIFKDTNGIIRHGWVIDVDEDLLKFIAMAAAQEGISVEDFIDNAVEAHVVQLMEEIEKRKALEEISD